MGEGPENTGPWRLSGLSQEAELWPAGDGMTPFLILIGRAPGKEWVGQV